MRIKRRDGTLAEVSDNYVLADGEALQVEMRMLDSGPRMICDAQGMPAGQRPGFLYGDGDIDEAVRVTAYRMYDEAIEQRWRSDRWQGGKPAPSPVRNGDAAAVEQAHAQYRREIEARWQR